MGSPERPSEAPEDSLERNKYLDQDCLTAFDLECSEYPSPDFHKEPYYPEKNKEPDVIMVKNEFKEEKQLEGLPPFIKKEEEKKEKKEKPPKEKKIV